MGGDSKSQMASTSHYWFNSYGNFAEWVGFACWWSCIIRKGLYLQPVQQAFCVAQGLKLVAYIDLSWLWSCILTFLFIYVHPSFLFPQHTLKLLKGSLEKNVKSVNMLIPPSDPPPLYLERFRLFFVLQCFFLDYWGCLVRCETDFVKLWVKLDKNNKKEKRKKNW